jgi:cytochrome oxidase Cu insertion factor (SCO1/SenC/PrrC family)
MSVRKIAVRFVAFLVIAYVLLFATVATAMLQTPDRFGMFMRYAPAPLVWGALPAERMWLWARAGALGPGDSAPDFTLPTQDGSNRVTLSSLRGRPVVLVFGSYT